MKFKTLYILLQALIVPSLSYSKIVNTVDSLILLSETLPDDTTKLNVYDEIMDETSNANIVLKYAKKELEIAQRLHLDKYQAHAYSFMGWSYYELGECDSSLNNLYKSAIIYDSLKCKPQIGFVYYLIGTTLSVKGDYISANDYLHKSANIYTNLNDTIWLINVYNQIGSTLIDFALYEESKTYFDKAFELCKGYNSDLKIADYYSYVGNNYRCMAIKKEYNDSLTTISINYLRAAYDIYEAHQLQDIDVAWLCEQLSDAYLNRAINMPEQCLQAADSSKFFNQRLSELSKLNDYKYGDISAEIWEINYRLTTNKINELKPLVAKLEKRLIEDPNELDASAYNALTTYFAKTGNFKKAYEYKTKEYEYEKDVLNKEFISNIVRTSSQIDFEDIMHKRDIEEHDKEMRHFYQTIIYSISAFLLLILIIAILIYNRRLKRQIMHLCEQIEKASAQRQMQKTIPIEQIDPDDTFNNSNFDAITLFNKVEEAIDAQHLYERADIDRDELAKIVGTNRTYLVNCIKEVTQKSFNDYLNTKRLVAATALLKERQELSMIEISEATGFSSYSTFYRVFNKEYGITPIDYRNYLIHKRA